MTDQPKPETGNPPPPRAWQDPHLYVIDIQQGSPVWASIDFPGEAWVDGEPITSDEWDELFRFSTEAHA